MTATSPKQRTSQNGQGRPRISMQFVVDGERTPGLQLVERLLQSGEDHEGSDLNQETAAEAIEALEHLELPWLVGEIIESGERFAEQVHSLATRGLQEVVQNADDQGAENIRFGLRVRKRGQTELLIAHDGNPVQLIDVLRMAWPLLSGSRADPEKIGRFGIGLKTLNQLGASLAVHCPPLPGFEIQGGRISRVKGARAIRRFWDPKRRETLFVLRLHSRQFDFGFFRDWLAGWDASSLLFLRHLRNVSLRDLSGSHKVLKCGIEVGKSRPVDLELSGGVDAQQVTVKDVASSRTWTRYSLRCRRPRRLKATHKELSEIVPLHLAIPERGQGTRLYVGLPLEEPCDLPYSCSAPFEPNVERTLLRDDSELNLDHFCELATAVSITRSAESPKRAWRTVPLDDEGAGASAWTQERFGEAVSKHRSQVSKKVRLRTADGATKRLSDLTYEPTQFDGLLFIG